MRELNPRARAVARYMLSGYSYPSIAIQLGISDNTVRLYASHILNATGQDNCVTATLYMLRNPVALAYVMECAL